MEVSSDEGKFHRSSEAVGIENILDAVEEVKRKVSEVIQEEVIDYGAIDDVITDDDDADVKKATSELQGEINSENYKQMMSATQSNASMKCFNSSMSINRHSLVLQEEKEEEEEEVCCKLANDY
jgi:hypothetical protein